MQTQQKKTWFQGLKLFNEIGNPNPDTWTVPKKGSPAHALINNSLRIPDRSKFVENMKSFKGSMDNLKSTVGKLYGVIAKSHTPVEYSSKIKQRKKMATQMQTILASPRKKSARIAKGVKKPERFNS